MQATPRRFVRKGLAQAAQRSQPKRELAADRLSCHEAITGFAGEYGAKYPKAMTTLEKDADALPTFFDFRAEHWKHLRTSNVIESPFATVHLRQRVTKGAGSRTKGLLMAYKLLDMARARWRRLDGAHLLPLVRACDVFVDGFQREGRAEIRVVMLTAFSDSERVFAALKAGAVGYLLKKVSPDEIRTTVQRTATASPCSPAGRSAVPDVGRRYLQRSATSEWLSTPTMGR